MRCPVCPESTLTTTVLEPQLPAQSCLRCGGVWLASSDYWAWLEQPAAPVSAPSDLSASVGDEPTGARRCAGCGHIMLRYPLARNLPFQLDQCGHCNSFWLDRHEWATQSERGLQRQLHTITNAPWQRRLRQEAQQATLRQLYTERFGPADYAEVQRVRAWLDNHPRRSMLLAYLSSPDPYHS